jgi:predicted RecB family nuclease
VGAGPLEVAPGLDDDEVAGADDEAHPSRVARVAPDLTLTGWRQLSRAAADTAPVTRLLSPTRLNDFLGCEHRTWLDLLADRGEIDRPPPAGGSTERLFERGRLHEASVLAGYRAEGRDVFAAPEDGTVEERAAATAAAMRAGREVITQACLTGDGWLGYADFLIRVAGPSDHGDHAYEVIDAKLGRDPKPSYVFQLLFYDREVTRIQGVRPAAMHVVLGDERLATFRPAELEAYGERVRRHFVRRRAELAEGTGAPVAYPYKVAQCDMCPWWQRCADKRRADDHVSLTATVHRAQGLKLEAAGVATLPALAGLDEDVRIPKLAAQTLQSIRAQASIQLRSRDLPVPLHELLDAEHGRGLHRLPAPSAGDVFFDFEGDPHWGDEGLEYLFGTLFRDGGVWRYDARWARDRAQEKAAFEAWMDWLAARRAEHPGLHVFHYNSYEPTALKRLAARHATREDELDLLLRAEVFVDLYGVVRQGVRVGVESYGLKAMEAVHGFARRESGGSLRGWSEFLETGDEALLGPIETYNEDDVRSTLSLLGWLRERAAELDLAALEPPEERPLSDRQRLVAERVEALRAPLTGGLPDNEADDDPGQRARRTAFALLGYHRREAKPAWWAFFARKHASTEELRDEDTEAIGGLEVVAERDTGKSFEWDMRYPEQELKLSEGDVADQHGYRASLLELDEAARRLTVRRGKRGGQAPPTSLIPGGPYNTDKHEDAVHRVASRVAERGLAPAGRYDAAVDVLARRAPRLRPGTPPLAAGPVDLDRLRAQVAGLDDSALVIQGPPGSGKTYTGARLALHLIERGLRVGVTSTSHKAIDNFLRALDEAADEAGVAFQGWKKDGDPQYTSRRFVEGAPGDEDDIRCTGATTWHWVRQDERSVDVLFVDEAGQVALADAIAAASAARSVVLLGDPQQLAHVSQGTHPHGAGASVLEHLLGDAATIDPRRGVFLDRTWRMHPDVCRFVSESMYDGRLAPVEHCAVRRIDAPGALTGTGLRLVPIEHAGNRRRSEEEAEWLAAALPDLLRGRFAEADGTTRELTLDDVLVVAPYNAQVRCLRAALPDGARVGTVDKFQGQEAPVVVFSMTSSSGDDIPRGLDFLFSRNRLNVAVSRAQALAVVLCSPALLHSPCRTVEDMRLINMLCRFAEAAQVVAA